MKKPIAGILSLTLALAASVPAFAADTTIGPAADPKTGSTAVSFNVDPTYTITIPEKVELEKKDMSGTVTYESTGTISAAPGLRLKNGEQIKVTLTTCDYKLSSTEGAELAYTVKAGETSITDPATPVATFVTNTQAQTSILTFAAGDPTYAGEYSDTVTFTVAVVTP